MYFGMGGVDRLFVGRFFTGIAVYVDVADQRNHNAVEMTC